MESIFIHNTLLVKKEKNTIKTNDTKVWNMFDVQGMLSEIL